MNLQVCKQCGVLKTLDQFRRYYGGRKGHYKTCKTCEKINSRFKYLTKKNNSSGVTVEEREELHKINTLYDLQLEQGLKPPGAQTDDTPIDLDAELQRHQAAVDARKAAAPDLDPEDVPAELAEWLTRDITTFDPDHLQEVIAEGLTKKYRPQIGVDPKSYNPIYDDKYRDALNKVLRRFDEYEDASE